MITSPLHLPLHYDWDIITTINFCLSKTERDWDDLQYGQFSLRGTDISLGLHEAGTLSAICVHEMRDDADVVISDETLDSIETLSDKGFIRQKWGRYFSTEQTQTARFNYAFSIPPHEVEEVRKCMDTNPIVRRAYRYAVERGTLCHEPTQDTFLETVARIALAGTGYGMTTVSTYRKTRDHISETGTIDPRFAKIICASYCGRKGAELAAQEAGIKLPVYK